LLQNPRESVETYRLRCREAAFRSYAGAVVDFFAAELFNSPFHVRAGEGADTLAPETYYAEFREDVDSLGTDLATAAKDAFVAALVKGRAYWACELPDDGDELPVNRADWQRRDLGRATVVEVQPEDLLDWETDEDSGEMLWAITHSKKARREEARATRTLTTETWKLYDREMVETYQVVYEKRVPQKHDPIPMLRRRPHGFPRIPIVEFRLPPGLWLMARIADAQIEHFRLSAALSWAIKRACYPQGVFHSEERESPPTTAAGTAITVGLDEKFEWLSPPAEAFQVVQKEIDNQRTEIYRVAQQMAASMNTSAASLDRSGDSKAADMAATEICLRAYGTHVRDFIERVFELISDARGDEDLQFSVEGMNVFNLDDRTGGINNIRTASDLKIPSKTLMTELYHRVADLLLPDVNQQTKDKIRGELLEAQDKPEPPPPAPAVVNGAPQAPPGMPPVAVPKPERPTAQA